MRVVVDGFTRGGKKGLSELLDVLDNDLRQLIRRLGAGRGGVEICQHYDGRLFLRLIGHKTVEAW